MKVISYYIFHIYPTFYSPLSGVHDHSNVVERKRGLASLQNVTVEKLRFSPFICLIHCTYVVYERLSFYDYKELVE